MTPISATSAATPTSPAAPSLLQHLRAATRPDHEAVDAAFSRFDLAERAGYGRFLSAQARALPGLERALDPAALLPGWTGRTAALEADLAALGLPVPPPLPLPPALPADLPAGAPARWGALYVLEGSRLGGTVLSRRIGQGLPRAFLLSAHPPGGWRAVMAAIDALPAGWRDGALAGARAAFALFLAACAREQAAQTVAAVGTV